MHTTSWHVVGRRRSGSKITAIANSHVCLYAWRLQGNNFLWWCAYVSFVTSRCFMSNCSDGHANTKSIPGSLCCRSVGNHARQTWQGEGRGSLESFCSPIASIIFEDSHKLPHVPIRRLISCSDKSLSISQKDFFLI